MYEIGQIRNVKTEKKCPVKGCTSVSSNKNLSFHKLPKNVEIADKWMNLLNIPRHSPVCSLHFNPEDFVPPNPNTKYPRLKRNALPSRNFPIRTGIVTRRDSAWLTSR